MGRGVGVLLIAVVVSFAGVARAECTKDTDCKGDRICDAGQCTAAPASAAPAIAAAAEQEPVEREHFFEEQESERPARVKKRIGNPGLMVGGIVLAAAAPVVLAVGVVTNPDCADPPCGIGGRVALFSLIALGMVGAGVPMIVIGAKRVPVRTLEVTPVLGPQHAGLQLQLRL